MRLVLSILLLLSAVVSSTAHASPQGGMLAGPTRVSGSTIYWNPAAVAQENGPATAALEAALFAARVGYTRSDTLGQQSYDPVDFSAVAALPGFTFSTPTLWKRLRLIGGGFSPTAGATRWPGEGPQRYTGTDNHYIAYSLVMGLAYVSEKFGVSLAAGPVYNSMLRTQAMDLGSYGNNLIGADILQTESELLEGNLRAKTSAWSAAAVAGLWAEPAPWLRLGFGFHYLSVARHKGRARVDLPSAFFDIFPGVELAPEGDLSLRFEMPMTFNSEAELRLGHFNVGLMFQMITHGSVANVTGGVTNADPDFIDGPQLSIVSRANDWLVGARLSRNFGERVEAGIRLDIDPRSIPDETLSSVALDFTQYEMSIGGLFRFGESSRITGTYAYIHVPDIVITDSLVQPRAGSGSGLDKPPPTGRYSVSAHKLIIGYMGSFGGQ